MKMIKILRNDHLQRVFKSGVALVVAVIFLAGFVATAMYYFINRAVDAAVRSEAISVSEYWADFFSKNLVGIDKILSTGEVDPKQIEFIQTFSKIGKVFRFKLFDKTGRLVLISDEVISKGTYLEAERKFEAHAFEAITTLKAVSEVASGAGKKNRPPLYAETYVPFYGRSKDVQGAVEVYVDQTDTQIKLKSSFFNLSLALAGLAGLFFAVPAFAYIKRTRSMVNLAKSTAAAEAAELEARKYSESLANLNRDLQDNMLKLSTAKDELVKKGRMEQLGQLTATVAHELRNPLGAVKTSAFLLERKLKDKNLGIETQLERINNGIVRCDNIITQLLDFSRTKQLNCSPGDIDSWLTGVVEEEVKKLPQNVSVELLLGLDGKSVPFDPGRMERAIINMINNAVEAMVSGGDQLLTKGQEQPKLVISTHEKNGHCSIRIVDNGPGIPDEILARIREPLFTTKSFGTGLGIPAIEQIAVQHGGRLDIETRVGEGSSFTIWFPIEQAVGEKAEKAA
jgi:signal transduction histidine kinase